MLLKPIRFPKPARLISLAYRQVPYSSWTRLNAAPIVAQWQSGSKSRSEYTFPKFSLKLTSTALALTNSDILDEKKTNLEIMLDQSREQMNQEIEAKLNRYGSVIKWLLRYIVKPLLIWVRFFKLLFLFTPLILSGVPLAFGITPQNYREAWYRFAVFSLQIAGPSFIKLGQWAASRADIFPAELCEQLGTLHSNAKEHSFEHTKKIVSASFNKPFEKCFAEFNDRPLGVGAMAQVYRAKLSTGQDVAVKVLHPGIRFTINCDLKIMTVLAKMINAIPTMEWLSLPGEVATFAFMMESQLDLRLEANNLNKFNEQFRKDKEVSFPQAHLDVSSRGLLVEQLVSGVSMEKVLKYCKQTEFDRRVAALGLDAFLKMLLLNNFIHSDLHAGNIFLSLDGPKGNELLGKLKVAKNQAEWDSVWGNLTAETIPHLWFIDAGLVTELNPSNRVNFVQLFKAIATFDGYKAGDLMVEKSRTPETVIDKEIFCLKTERLVNQVKKRTFALASVSIGDLLTNMMDMVRKHHVRMESDFVTVVISILLLEGIGRRLDPDLDIFKSSLPVLRKVSQQQASNLPITDFKTEDILQMLKVWLVLETRQFITASVQDIYRCVKYDRLSPNN